MEEQVALAETGAPGNDDAEIIEIRDPEVDVEAIMAQIRANVARRRAEGAYQEDLDAIAAQVFAEVKASQPSSLSTISGEGGLAATLAELNTRWIVREVSFSSHVPVVGRLIVAVRNFWNWMSTKWYVQAIVQQLVGFNALVVRTFNEMNAEHEALAQEVRQLETTCEQQQEQIRLLQEQVEQLRAPRSPQGNSEDAGKP